MLIRDVEGQSGGFYPWVWRSEVFSKEELNVILDNYSDNGLYPAGVIKADSQSDDVTIDDIRSSDVNMHYMNDDNKWIFERLDYVINWANENFYKFDLTGYSFFQFGVYDADKGGYYGLHMDTYIGANSLNNGQQRKLSLSILLNDDFEGGEFVITKGGNKEETIKLDPGMAVIFPSFIVHGVKKVTKGVRKSLVVWVEGPPFK
jgi:PKHD-type hydroxylase